MTGTHHTAGVLKGTALRQALTILQVLYKGQHCDRHSPYCRHSKRDSTMTGTHHDVSVLVDELEHFLQAPETALEAPGKAQICLPQDHIVSTGLTISITVHLQMRVFMGGGGEGMS